MSQWQYLASSSAPTPSAEIKAPESSLRVNVPSDLEGVAYIQVIIQKEQDLLSQATLTNPADHPSNNNGGSGREQVWPLTQFYSVNFLLKLIDLPGGQINEPSYFSLPFLPATASSPSRCVASGTTEIQGHRQVCRARCGGHRTPSRAADAILDCAFVENALIYTDPRL